MFWALSKLLKGSDPMIKQKQIVLGISKFINKLSYTINFLITNWLYYYNFILY